MSQLQREHEKLIEAERKEQEGMQFSDHMHHLYMHYLLLPSTCSLYCFSQLVYTRKRKPSKGREGLLRSSRQKRRRREGLPGGKKRKQKN